MNFKKLISMLLSVACAFTFIAATPGIDLNALTTSDNAPIVTAELEGSVMGTITSDEVIQNGGFPKQTSKISSIQSLESQHYRAVNSALRSKLLTAWNSCAAQIDIRSMNIKLQDVADTYFAVLNANPQFFYITSGFSYNWNPSTQIVNYIVIKYNYNVSQIPSLVSKFNAKTDEILKQVNAGWSDVEKALFVHDYFATNCEYDTSYNNYNAYNVIVDGVAVCQGYALAYQHIMNKLNIPCKVVTTEQMNHAWNTIKVNGAWYYVDITWDDPVPDTLGYSRHVNFLKNEAYFKSDASGHYGTDWLVDSANAMGVVTNPSYNNFFWNNYNGTIPNIGRRWYYYNYSDVLCYYDFSTQKSVSLNSITDRWYAWGSTTQYYRAHQVSQLVTIGNKVYYSTPKAIMSMNADGTGQKVEYTLTASQANLGYIYSIVKSGNSIRYYVQQSPTGAVKTSGIYTPTNSTIPAKPQVKATAGNGQVTLTWNKVPGATSYRVYQYVNGKYIVLANTSATSYTKTGLNNGTTYQFLVLAYNGTYFSSYTDADRVSAKPIASLSKPVVKAKAGNRQVTLSWNNVPGATSYRVYQYVNDKYIVLANTSATSYTKTGLNNGTTYQFLVLAYNGTYFSSYTDADRVSAKPIAPLSKPVVKAKAGNRQVTLSWNNVPGATSYRVYQYVNDKYIVLANTSATSYTKTGLNNGTTYQFLVLAYNGTYFSSYTDADRVSAKPIAVPAKPTVAATTGNGSVTLSWNKVSGATSYRIYQYINGTYKILGNTSSTSFTKSGLTNGITYQFLVLAYNGTYFSPYTSADLVTVKPMPPLSKPVVKATAGNRQVTLSWNKVPGATSYRVYQYVNGKYIILANTSATSYTKTGLNNGTTYQFLVLAYNGTYFSSYTDADRVSARPIAPPAKPIVNATAGNGSVTLSWNKVSGATSYRIYQYINGTYVILGNTSSTSFTKSGLTNGTTYQFLVLAYNGTYFSPYTSTDLVSARPMGKPAKPVVKATTSNGSVTLSWNKVNGAIKYRVYQYVNGTYKILGDTTDTAFIKTGLTNGTTYQFLVLAYNGTYYSPYTTVDLVTVKLIG